MMSIKKLVTTALLISTLSLTTLAGDMNTPGYTAPPPDDNSHSHASPTNANDRTWLDELLSEATDLTTEALLGLLSRL